MPVVDGWFHEVHSGNACQFACIQYERFGFALTRSQVEVLIRKLASLLRDGVCDVDEDSDLHVDWSQADSDWIMIAFRPSEDCQGRFYDIPKPAARDLLAKLERLRDRSGEAPEPAARGESA